MCVLYYKEKDQNCSASTTMLCNCLISDKTGVIEMNAFSTVAFIFIVVFAGFSVTGN